MNKAEVVSKKVTLHVETSFSWVPVSNTVTCVIEDSEGNIVYQSSSIDFDMTFEDEITLGADECYTFRVDGSHVIDFFNVMELKDESQTVVPLDSYIDNYRVYFRTDLQNSVEGLEEDVNLLVYPSPVTDYLSLKLENDFDENIQMNGALISTEEINFSNKGEVKRLDVSNLSPGLYFLQLESESSTKTVKFVKS